MQKFTIKWLLAFVMLPLLSFQTYAQESEGCDYTLKLYHKYNEGWGDNSINVWVNDVIVIENATKKDEDPDVKELKFNASTGDKIKIKVNKVYPYTSIKWELYSTDNKFLKKQGFYEWNFPEVLIDAVCPSDFDYTVSSLRNPVSSNKLGKNEDIKIVVSNLGISDCSDEFQVSYIINDEPKVTETVTGVTVSALGEYEYTFKTKANFSERKIYNIKAEVKLNIDENTENDDSFEADVYSGAPNNLFYFDYQLENIQKAKFPRISENNEIISKEPIDLNYILSLASVEDGLIYAVTGYDSIISFDPISKKKLKSIPIRGEFSFSEMDAFVYNAAKKEALLLAGNKGKSCLFSVDLVSGFVSKLTTLKYICEEMAITKEGKIYLVEKNILSPKLFELNRDDFSLTELFAIDSKKFYGNKNQDLVIDYSSGAMYMNCFKSSGYDSEVHYIDLEHKKSYFLGKSTVDNN
ncbi:MAG: hypothetical protein ACEPOW_10265, partial [Bacteroidales bacterium]